MKIKDGHFLSQPFMEDFRAFGMLIDVLMATWDEPSDEITRDYSFG